MWGMAAWAAIAVARPDEPFPRRDEPVVVRRFQRVDGARARYRNSKGSFEVWAFPNGDIEHYRLWDRKKLVEQRWFNALGDPLVSVNYVDMNPIVAIVHGGEDHSVAVEHWVDTSFGPWRIPAPNADQAGSWDLPELHAQSTWTTDVLDVWSTPFQQGLLLGCACILLDRTTAWVDGRIGARFILHAPSASDPQLGEVWAVPSPEGTLIFSYSAPGTPDEPDIAGPLATGRAMMVLTHREGRR